MPFNYPQCHVQEGLSNKGCAIKDYLFNGLYLAKYLLSLYRILSQMDNVLCSFELRDIVLSFLIDLDWSSLNLSVIATHTFMHIDDIQNMS